MSTKENGKTTILPEWIFIPGNLRKEGIMSPAFTP
jgi:hypothetical protein